MSGRFPNYDVLSKRDSMSWNDATRRAVDERLAVEDKPIFFTHEEYATLRMVCDRILPQPGRIRRVPIAAYIDRQMKEHGDRGTRYEPMPYAGECWKICLSALDAEAKESFGRPFHELEPHEADRLLTFCQKNELVNPAWQGIPSEMFFKRRALSDIPAAYYAHPMAWSEIGFGGPASPRGYVRMQANRRDPWEAAEAHPGKVSEARRANAKLG